MWNNIEHKKAAHNVLAILKKSGFSQSEVYLLNYSVLSLERRENNITFPKYFKEGGAQIRVIDNGELKTFYSNDLSEKSILDMVEKLSMPGIKIPENYKFSDEITKREFTTEFDEKLSEVSINQKWKLLDELSEKTYEQNFSIKYILLTEYREVLQKKSYFNSNGVELTFDSSNFQLLVDAVAVKGRKKSFGTGVSLSTKFEELNIDKAAELAAECARVKLYDNNIEKKSYPILFKPYAATTLVYTAWRILTAELNQNRDDKKISFSNKFNVINDPTLKNSTGRKPFDSDGTIAQKIDIIENGELINLLYNRITAFGSNKTITGSHELFSITANPSISVSNMYLKPQEALISLPENDFLEIISIELSPDLWGVKDKIKLVASGIYHSETETRPFSELSILLPIDEFPGKIISVGYDLNFYPFGKGGIYGSPSFLCENVEII